MLLSCVCARQGELGAQGCHGSQRAAAPARGCPARPLAVALPITDPA